MLAAHAASIASLNCIYFRPGDCVAPALVALEAMFKNHHVSTVLAEPRSAADLVRSMKCAAHTNRPMHRQK